LAHALLAYAVSSWKEIAMLMFLIRAAALTCLTLAFAVPAMPQGASAPSSESIAALRGGGYVMVLRHGATNPDQADTDPLNITDLSKQRLLSDQGRALAKSMGESLHKLNIPVSQVQTSKFNRAIETGALLGYGEVSPSFDFTEGGLVVPPKENDRRAKALRAAAGTTPAAGTNVIIVTHKPNLLDAFGKDWFDIREGEMSIFKPDGNGGYTFVARVQAGDWAKLVQTAK
jgi:phosphohistidine phosphatase SixA